MHSQKAVFMMSLNFEPELFSAVVPTHDTSEANQQPITSMRMRPKSIRARILWPALGFPAVVGPHTNGATHPFATDASRCICLLILSDQPYLSKEDVAQHLRIVPWSERTRRQIPANQPGVFAVDDLGVHNDGKNNDLAWPAKDEHGDAFVFGGSDRSGIDPVVVSLSRDVRKFYSDQRLTFLHEVRVSESASARFQDGLYHLFWNNAASEGQPSDEMQLLIDNFARPRRHKLGPLWNSWQDFFIEEYKFDYGALHPPYHKSDPQRRFTEVLHPVFIKHYNRPLRLAHVTDTHVHVRDDAYEANLEKQSTMFPSLVYNNFNKSFIGVYTDAKASADAILLTGDLVDYGRGHVGPGLNGQFLNTLGEDEYYHEDRNWFLFYYLLASGDNYEIPTYTSLGNHDWRLNPYPPFAPGHPSPVDLIHNANALTSDQLEKIISTAHGRGYDRGFSYTLNLDEHNIPIRQIGKAFFIHDYDTPGSPLQTTVEAIKWYLLLINPFLDYQVKLPDGQQLLMIDWGQKEMVENEDAPYEPTSAGPQAKNCLTPLQKWHVEQFLTRSGRAKIIGMHAPPLGPYPQWTDSDLKLGFKKYRFGENSRHRAPNYEFLLYPEHSLFAIRPHDQPFGTDANYNSFLNGRDEFIQKVADSRGGVRLILSGHIHRNGLFIATAPFGRSPGWMLRDVSSAKVNGVAWPAVATNDSSRDTFLGPLYVNTTSTGPRGNLWLTSGHQSVNPGWTLVSIASDGTISSVSRRQLIVPRPATRKPSSPVPEFEYAFDSNHATFTANAGQKREIHPPHMNAQVNFEPETFSGYELSNNDDHYEAERFRTNFSGSLKHSLYAKGTGHFKHHHWERRGDFGGRRFGSANSTQDQQATGWARNCLSQITGSNVPQSDHTTHSTRRAIRRFQTQNQLQPTGRLDQATTSALQQACGDGGGDTDSGEMPPPIPPPDWSHPFSSQVQYQTAPMPQHPGPDGHQSLELWFEWNSARLRQDKEVNSVTQFAMIVNRVLDHLRAAGPSARVVVRGFSSHEGAELHNRFLSSRRAERVKSLLGEAGVPEDRIDAIGAGPSNAWPGGLKWNRRAEIDLQS
jgi:outer membrane protein OmpA-like peptidoglycan-associated protein